MAQIRELKLAHHLNLAMCHMKLGNMQKAQINCTKALAIDPKNVKALFRRCAPRKPRTPRARRPCRTATHHTHTSHTARRRIAVSTRALRPPAAEESASRS
eukprot:3365334-Prymnesium_polylepis.1